ncbi:hypothetical protein BH20ACT16_BH20ACT16_04720 [soil metagenome]
MDALIGTDLRSAGRALEDLVTRRMDLRRECEDAVVEWRWAREGSDLQRPQPLYRQRYGLPAPRPLERAPAPPEDQQQYGVDADGNIVVAREYTGSESFREELRVARGDTVVGYRWSETGDPSEVNIARFSEGRIRSYVTVRAEGRSDSLRGASSERYDYDGDLVSEIYDDSDVAFGDIPLQDGPMRIRASYDPAGRLLELREHGDRGEKVLYRARGSGPSMDALQRHVEDRLVETLPPLVREHAGDEPIYCLVLHYHPEWPLPPTVGLGLERDRQAWMQTIADSQTLKLTVWNPAEFSNYRGETVTWDLNDIDPQLARAIGAIPEHDDGAAERARATLNRAARRLQRLDWSSIAPVTDDFVVFAVDYELTHLQENLHHNLPSPLRNALTRRALL